MEQEDSNLFLRMGAFAVGLLLLTSPLWKPKADEIEEPLPVATSQRAPGETLEFRHAGDEKKLRLRTQQEEVIRSQLRRHAMNQHNGFYERVVDNPKMDPEVRKRFAVERDRLAKLAEEHPELATNSQQNLPPRQLDEKGEFTEDFKKAVHNMKTYGVWQEMVDDHVENLVRDANNPNIPEDERPTAEQIERARSQQLILVP